MGRADGNRGLRDLVQHRRSNASLCLREQPLRPRQHDPGRLEHRSRSAARADQRIRRRVHSLRRARRADSRGFRSALVDLADPAMLIAVQGILLAVGALPVFWLGRKHLSSEHSAALFAFSYLLYLPVQYSALNDFHPVTLAIPFLLFAIWYADENRLLPFLIFAILAASTKEEIPLAVAGLAVWFAIRHRRWLMGAAVAGGAVLWTVVAIGLVIPHYSPSGANPFSGRYAAVGDSPRALATTIVTDPAEIAEQMAEPRDRAYLLSLFAPYAFLSAGAPLLLLPAIPGTSGQFTLGILVSDVDAVSIRKRDRPIRRRGRSLRPTPGRKTIPQVSTSAPAPRVDGLPDGRTRSAFALG